MMKTRLSILLLTSLILSACGATAVPTATLLESTPTVFTPQEPTSTASIVTPTLDMATILVTEQSATPESTITPPAIPPIEQVKMEVLLDGQQTALPPPAVCQRTQNWVAYTVAWNDTLSSLGQRTGTSWQQIQSANCLTSTTIFAGQTLYLPFVPAPVVDINPVTISPTPLPPGPIFSTVIVTPQIGPPGTIFKIFIVLFPPNQEIKVIIQKEDSEDVVTLGIIADGNGKATMSYISPQNALAGRYNVTAINIAAQQQASDGFTITGP